ncbi:20051_t:CDS:2, partial [Dentiscutata erythropus]
DTENASRINYAKCSKKKIDDRSVNIENKIIDCVSKDDTNINIDSISLCDKHVYKNVDDKRKGLTWKYMNKKISNKVVGNISGIEIDLDEDEFVNIRCIKCELTENDNIDKEKKKCCNEKDNDKEYDDKNKWCVEFGGASMSHPIPYEH